MDQAPWQPMTKAIDIKFIGKLIEELSELSSALSRCLIQGINEVSPDTGKLNKQWVEEEIADVYANLSLVEEHFDLKMLYERIDHKLERLSKWHKALDISDEKPNDL